MSGERIDLDLMISDGKVESNFKKMEFIYLNIDPIRHRIYNHKSYSKN